MIKKVLKFFLKLYLKLLTKLAILIHRPKIIAIAGSVNKSFFRDEIKRVLIEKKYSVRANPKNFNTEIGLPLAILNLPSGYNSYKNWLPIIWQASKALWQKFPEFLVLELGVSDQGDMSYLLSLIKPDIAVITDITQRYSEGFDDMDELVDEYKILVKKINSSGLVVLNIDNERVKNLAGETKAKVQTFSLKNTADWQAEVIKKTTEGQMIKIKNQNNILNHAINRFGCQHAQAFLTALAIGAFYERSQEEKGDALAQAGL